MELVNGSPSVPVGRNEEDNSASSLWSSSSFKRTVFPPPHPDSSVRIQSSVESLLDPAWLREHKLASSSITNTSSVSEEDSPSLSSS